MNRSRVGYPAERYSRGSREGQGSGRRRAQEQRLSNFFEDDGFGFGGGAIDRFMSDGLGGGMFGARGRGEDVFQRMDAMMSSAFGGRGMGMDMGIGSMMPDLDQMMRMGSAGDGVTSSSHCVMMSSGPDGNTQRFESHSNSVGSGQNRKTETKQAYRNSAGLDKIGWERTIGSRGRKVVKERHRGSNTETTHNMYHNMDENQTDEFDRVWGDGIGRSSRALPSARAQSNRYLSDSYSHARPSRQPQRRRPEPISRQQPMRGRGDLFIGNRNSSNSRDVALAERLAREEARRAGLGDID